MDDMFNIKFRIEFTKELAKDAEKEILAVLESLKEKFKQLGKEFVAKHKMEGASSIVLELESKEPTATEAVVLLDKHCREKLGKTFKMGVKDVKIMHYEISEPVEVMPEKEVTLPLVKSLSFKDKKAILVYENFPFEWLKLNYVERSIKLLKDKIKMLAYEGKDEFKEYVWEGKQRSMDYNGDPAEDMEKSGWIKRTEAKGQFVYGREFTALINVFKGLFIEKVYKPLGFFEMTFPKFEPWAVPKRSGHAKNVYPNAYFVSVPKKATPGYWQEVMDLFAITGEVQTDKIMEKTECVGIMSYAQCPPFWPYLQNKTIEETTLPLLIYDWSGPTYRNESGGTHGLDRVEEFNRIETLFTGTREQVVKTWLVLKGAFITFYDEVLDMEIKVAKVTPWWMAHAGIKSVSENPDVGTFDFDAYLPYRGDREKEWLEVQNDSSNGDKYPVAFNVKGRKGEYLWSGCAGASFQRIVVAFLAQKGLDTKNWPVEVRKRFEEQTKGLKTLKFY